MSDKTIKGLTKVLKDLEKFGSESKKEVEEITKISSMDIVADAKAFAPKNLGKLAQSIIFTKVGEADYKVVVNSPYGAYVEFGTGAKVRVPAELQDVASQFKGKKGGSFEQGLQGIKDWCKNKGIPESAAYPIFMSILLNHIFWLTFLITLLNLLNIVFDPLQMPDINTAVVLDLFAIYS